MENYPFIRCLHPKKVFNPYLREYLTTTCGKCQSCQNARGSRYALQIRLEAQSCKHVLFGTLTYSNDYIPKLGLVPLRDSLNYVIGYELFDKDSGEYLDYFPSNSTDVQVLLRKVNMQGELPYLRKSDIQLFFKRLRKSISNIFPDVKVRYYACGEYGPEHFRPHFHFLLFFNETKLLEPTQHTLGEFPDWQWYDSENNYDRSQRLSTVEYLIRKSWKFGRIDAQTPKGDCAQYVASYVGNFSTLPKVYKLSSTRPFSVHSQFLGQGFLKGQLKEVYATPTRDFIQRSIKVGSNDMEFTVWRSAYSAFYPKCKGFVGKSSRERLYAYQLIQTAQRLYPFASSTLDLARLTFTSLHFYFLSGRTVSPDSAFEDVYLRYFLGSLNIRSLVVDLDDSVVCDRLIYCIYTELLMSKHFLNFCVAHSGLSPVNVLGKIENFYSDLDYLRLTDWYQSQQDYFSLDFANEDDYVYFFDNLNYSMSSFKLSPAYRKFCVSVDKTYQQRIKHKLLNDKNLIFSNM